MVFFVAENFNDLFNQNTIVFITEPELPEILNA
jgi:hypothetical protein